jgi:hypothetical protein
MPTSLKRHRALAELAPAPARGPQLPHSTFANMLHDGRGPEATVPLARGCASVPRAPS